MVKRFSILFLVSAGLTFADLPSTPQSRGGAIATQIISQCNQFSKSVRSVLDKGIMPDGNNPAVSSQEVKDALGQENLKRIEAALKALDGK